MEKKVDPQARIFLVKFFDKLTENDFLKDNILIEFYKTYKKELETNKISLFSFYIEYITRNKKYNNDDLDHLYTEIKSSMLNPVQHTEEQDDNPRLSRLEHDNRLEHDSSRLEHDNKSEHDSSRLEVKQHRVKPVEIKQSAKPNTIKLNKRLALAVIVEYIKQSFIVVYEDPEEIITQDDEEFRDKATTIVKDEIIAAYGMLPVAQKDKRFGKRNELLEIWRDTEHKCIKFIENDALANILKTIYLFNAKVLLDNPHQPIKTIILPIQDKLINEEYEDDEDHEELVPEITVAPRYSNNRYNSIVSVLQSSALTETIVRARQKIKCLLVNSGSQMIPGGGSDQGIETNETALFYSSSYNLCLNLITSVYPLECDQITIMPHVLMFKDHTDNKYKMVAPDEGVNISVLNVGVPYRPETNIVNQNKTDMDERLYLPSTQYTDHNKILDQFRCVINSALFFGYDTIVFDDYGIEDFWLPAWHTAQLMSYVINENRGRFREIVIATNKPHLLSIYKKIVYG